MQPILHQRSINLGATVRKKALGAVMIEDAAILGRKLSHVQVDLLNGIGVHAGLLEMGGPPAGPAWQDAHQNHFRSWSGTMDVLQRLKDALGGRWHRRFYGHLLIIVAFGLHFGKTQVIRAYQHCCNCWRLL